MIRWENTLRSHPFFTRAAIGAVKTYLLLAEKPHLAHGSLANGGDGEVDFDSLSTADRKKALKKAKREAQKQQEKEAAERAAKKDDKKITGEDAPKKEDDDPVGQKLAQTAEPLVDAMKFVNALVEYSPLLLKVQNIAFEVYLRRSMFSGLSYPYNGTELTITTEKHLLALKSLLAAHKLSPEDVTVHENIIRFKKSCEYSRAFQTNFYKQIG